MLSKFEANCCRVVTTTGTDENGHGSRWRMAGVKYRNVHFRPFPVIRTDKSCSRMQTFDLNKRATVLASVTEDRVRTLLCTALLAISTADTTEASVPPVPANFTASFNAIEALTIFIGEWHGQETVRLQNDQSYSQRIYWRILRLGGQDILLFERGYESDNPNSGRESDKPHAQQFDILTFDPTYNVYQMYLSGYRAFTGSESTGQVVPVLQPSPQQISWSFAVQNGAMRRVTLSLMNSGLSETLDVIAANGALKHISEGTLHFQPRH